MPTTYWLQRDGKSAGPFTASQLKQMVAGGIVAETDLVSTDQSAWAVAGSIPGLFGKEVPPPLPANSTRTAEAQEPVLEVPDAGPIRFRCKQCDSILSVPATLRGKQAKCPRCHALVSVPSASLAGSAAKRVSRPRAKQWMGMDKAREAVKGMPRRYFHEYRCPNCSAEFLAGHLRIRPAQYGLPAYEVSFLSGAEKSRCPSCKAKLGLVQKRRIQGNT